MTQFPLVLPLLARSSPWFLLPYIFNLEVDSKKGVLADLKQFF